MQFTSQPRKQKSSIKMMSGGSLVFNDNNGILKEVKRSTRENVSKDATKVKHTQTNQVNHAEVMNVYTMNPKKMVFIEPIQKETLENNFVAHNPSYPLKSQKPVVKKVVANQLPLEKENGKNKSPAMNTYEVQAFIAKQLKETLQHYDANIENRIEKRIQQEFDKNVLKKHVTPFIQESLESYKNHFDNNNKDNDSFDETKITEIIKNEVKHIQESIKGLQTTIHQLPFEQKLEETVKKLKEEWNGRWKEHASNIENIEKKSLHMEVVEKTVEEFIENYFKEIKRLEEEVVIDDDLEEAQTRFEETIEPAVARIFQRVMKYDSHHESNVDIGFDDTKEELEYDSVHKNEDKIASIEKYNPMYEVSSDVRHDSSNNVDIDSVYEKPDHIKFQNNELRNKKINNYKWIRLGNGIDNGMVHDLCMDSINRKIYISGSFQYVNHVPMKNLSVYDLHTKLWSNVGEGVPNLASCMVLDEEKQILYVGGIFNKVGNRNVQAFNIAAYYIREQVWKALGNGLNRECSCMVLDKQNHKLYAGGSFTYSGKKKIHHIGIYDIVKNEWIPLDGGALNGPCRSLVKPTQDDLYVGGLFTHAGKNDLHVSYIAKYNINTKEWSDLNGGLQGYCNTMAYNAKYHKLYAGGTFTSCGMGDNTINSNHIAQYNTETSKWENMNGGLNSVVNSLQCDNTNTFLYIGGGFTHTRDDNVLLNHIAKYNIQTQIFQPLENQFVKDNDNESDNIGTNGQCKVLSVDSNSLLVAGKFQIAGNITANSIARYIIKR